MVNTAALSITIAVGRAVPLLFKPNEHHSKPSRARRGVPGGRPVNLAKAINTLGGEIRPEIPCPLVAEVIRASEPWRETSTPDLAIFRREFCRI